MMVRSGVSSACAADPWQTSPPRIINTRIVRRAQAAIIAFTPGFIVDSIKQARNRQAALGRSLRGQSVRLASLARRHGGAEPAPNGLLTAQPIFWWETDNGS